MKEPGKTGWHVQLLQDMCYLDKGETFPLIEESIVALPENGRRNGLCSFLPDFLTAQHLHRREWQNLVLCHSRGKMLRMDDPSPQVCIEMGFDCK